MPMIRRTLEGLPHVIEIGLEFLDIDRGRCSARLPYRWRLAGNPDSGVLHGGAVTTLMDTVSGAAAFSVVARGSSVATLDLRIDYLRSARPTDAIVGEASCYRLARSVAFVRGEAFDTERNHPVAHFVATFVVGSVGFVPGNKQSE